MAVSVTVSPTFSMVGTRSSEHPLGGLQRACTRQFPPSDAARIRELEIEQLRLQIGKLRRMPFGRSSERISRQIEQIELRLEERKSSEAADAPAPRPLLRRRRG